MASLVQTRPTPASAEFFKLCSRVLQPVAKRHESSYRRMRHKLNVKPDPAFLPTKTEPHDHIIFNPPSSMPNVYHTPTIFLPKDDKRRAIQAALARQSEASRKEELPPPVKQPQEKRYHLNEKDMEEMRSLRREDPDQWSVLKLARKYDCSTFFVYTVTGGLAKEKAQQQKQVTDVVKSNWGIKRRTAREDRTIRKERWFRDE